MSETIEVTGDCATWIRARPAAYVELVKPRIAVMVIVVTGLGFCLALPRGADLAVLPLLLHTLLGTGLVGAGSNVLNQYFEAELDGRMVRTLNRPLPSGRLSSGEALAFGLSLSVLGVGYLCAMVNPLCGALGAGGILLYTFVYTPLKRWTPLSVFVGAIPGALPPVIGWCAVTGSVSAPAILLFAILFFWQLPHFASISWLYRGDYARAGFPMMPVVDPGGRRTSLHLITQTVALVMASLLPMFHGLAGPTYAVGAMVLGAAFLAFGGLFVCRKTAATARLHVLASVVYLPLLLTLMMLDRVPAS
ncbi:MAG: heme o synthase [Phycisphaerae bacterium]